MVNWDRVTREHPNHLTHLALPAWTEALSARRVTIDDVELVLGLIHAAERADIGEPMFDGGDITADWTNPAIDLDNDVLLVEADGKPVAWAQVHAERADVHIHPDHRGRGLGSAVLEWTEHRGAEVGGRIGQTVPTNVAETADLFRSRGYEQLWESWVLRLPTSAVIDTEAPPGVTIRPFQASEERTVYALIDQAFSEWEGREQQPFDRWRLATTARADFDPELLLVAVASDTADTGDTRDSADTGEEGPIVGAIVGLDYVEEGWAQQVAVDPGHRGRGIATALLGTLFERFRARGQTRLGLNTDSRTGALDLYLRLGMVVEHSFTRWSRALPG